MHREQLHSVDACYTHKESQPGSLHSKSLTPRVYHYFYSSSTVWHVTTRHRQLVHITFMTSVKNWRHYVRQSRHQSWRQTIKTCHDVKQSRHQSWRQAVKTSVMTSDSQDISHGVKQSRHQSCGQTLKTSVMTSNSQDISHDIKQSRHQSWH